MQQNGKNPENKLDDNPGGISRIEQIIPLAQQINCLDIERIANVCIKNIPDLVGVRLASLYVLDETNNILHLQKCNHPFLLNKIVSLNQTPPSPMVMAVRSKGFIQVGNIDTHTKPVIKKSQTSNKYHNNILITLLNLTNQYQ